MRLNNEADGEVGIETAFKRNSRKIAALQESLGRKPTWQEVLAEIDCDNVIDKGGDMIEILKITDDLGEVRFSQEKDLPYIISLSKKENHALGFIPKMAYESAITGIKNGDRWSNVCNDKLFVIECNGDLVGFCLASFGIPNAISKKGKIAQICLQTDARKLLRGRKLLDSVINYGATIGTMAFSAGCADDLESNIFWKTMGWICIAQRKGISHTNTWKQTSKRVINIYRFDKSDMFLNVLSYG